MSAEGEEKPATIKSELSLSQYSSSVIRPYLPAKLTDDEEGVSNLDLVCYSALIESQVSGPGLYCNSVPVTLDHKEDFLMRADWCNITKNTKNGLWQWSIIVPEDSMPENLSIPCFKKWGERDDFTMRRLRHDLTALALTDRITDIKLSAIFPDHDFRPDEALKTPDIHHRLNGVDYIVEIGTTSASDYNPMVADLVEKVAKYYGPLSNVNSPRPIVFVVIIIGRFGVVSNVSLPIRVVRSLVYTLKLGLLWQYYVQGEGLGRLVEPADTKQEAVRQAINEQFTEVPISEDPYDPDKPLNITKDFIASLKTKADKDKVMKYWARELQTQIDGAEATRKREATSGTKARDEYIKTLQEQDSRHISKPIVPMPLFVVPRSAEIDPVVVPQVVCALEDKQPAILNLWQASFSNYDRAPHDYLAKVRERAEEMYEEDPVTQQQIEKKNKETRRKAHRVIVKGQLTDSDKHTLGLDGLWAKSMKGDIEKVEKQKITKLPWNWDTDMSDIEGFIKRTDVYEDYLHGEGGVNPKVIGLLKHSLTTTNQKTSHVKDLEAWMKTKLVCALSICEDIVHEIAISAKQYVNSKEVIVKKLGYYDVYLLIVPTKASEHIFFSIFIPPQDGMEVLSDLPFRLLRPTATGAYYTDLCSFRADKLSNAGTIMQSFLTSACYWCHHYGIKEFRPMKIMNCRDALIMANLTLLITLENKQDTEVAITATRYMYMEVMKSDTYFSPNPSRIICKLSTKPRSRLALFVIRRILSVFQIMVETGVKKLVKDDPTEESMMDKDEDALNADHWTGLLNPYTLGRETSGAKVVMLFYLGYAIDKNLVSQANADYQTIEKALREDIKFDSSEAHKSNGSWDDFNDTPKDKQFSVETVKYGVELLCRQLERTMGRGFKEVLMDGALKRLVNHMTSELASTKASANIEHVSPERLPTVDEVLLRKSGRLKVIEALILELGLFEHNPYMSLAAIVHCIQETSRGLICDLFKKNQHGGIREIYVLTIKSRILALFIESCARELCSHFTQETMTHPDHKMEVAESHKTAVAFKAKKQDCPYITLHCSADKKSWNNNLVMPVLSVPLFMMLPDRMHGMIQNVLNMWTERLIKVPDGVLKLLMSSTKLSCPTYQIMLDEFQNPGSVCDSPMFPERHSPFVILRTGMMQGILHYTSSLLHVAFLECTKQLIMNTIRVYSVRAEPVVDQMCSSDDSATIISLIFNKETTKLERQRAVLLVEILCQTLTKFCQYSCFTNSEKSNMGAPHVLEFNSEFIIMNTLAVPTFKWLLATLNVAEAESLMLRSISSYNLLSQVFSAGLPGYFTAIVQACQGVLHYRLLGANTSIHFPQYAEEIRRHPDPHLGYFILDDIHAPGLLGYDYQYWKHCTVHNLFPLKKGKYIDGSLSVTPEGGLTDQFLVHHGDSRRYHKLLEVVSGGSKTSEMRENVNDNYHLLYTEAGSKSDAEIKIQAKALSGGVAQSLSRGVAFLQAISISTYMMYSFCFTRYDSSFVDGKVARDRSKISLLAELKKRYLSRSLGKYYLAGDEAEKVCFPNWFRYRTYSDILKAYSYAEEKVITPMRYRKSTINLLRSTSATAVPLMDLVMEKWFGKPNKFSIINKDESWKFYVELMPWLSESITQTLEDSPFEDHISLHNFVTANPKGVRKFTRVGPAIRAAHPVAQISQIARRTWKDGRILELPADLRKITTMAYRDRRTAFGLALEIPNKEERNAIVSHAVGLHPVSSDELLTTKGRHRREAVLAIMVACLQKVNPNDIKRAIEQLGHGLFLGWITPQVKHTFSDPSGKVTNKWVGKGELTLCNDELTCIVRVVDNQVVEFTVNTVRSLEKHHHQVMQSLYELGFTLAPGPLTTRGRPMVYAHYMIRKQVTTKPNGPGVIHGTEASPVVNPDLSGLLFRVEIERGKMIMKQYKKNSPAHTVLEYRVLDHEFSAEQTGQEQIDTWMAWFTQAPLKAISASKTLALLRGRYEEDISQLGSPQKETKEMRDFFAETLRARLRHKSYDITYLPKMLGRRMEQETVVALCEERDYDEEFYQALKKSYEEGYDYEIWSKLDCLADKCSLEEAEANEMVADALEGTFTNSNLNAFYESLLYHKPTVDFCTTRLTNIYSVLPFWDPFIDMVKQHNPKAWEHIICGKAACSVAPDVASNISWLLFDKEPVALIPINVNPGDEVEREAIRAIYAGSVYSSKSQVLNNPVLKRDLRQMARDRITQDLGLLNPVALEIILDAIGKAQDDLNEKHGLTEDVDQPKVSDPEAVDLWVSDQAKRLPAPSLKYYSSESESDDDEQFGGFFASESEDEEPAVDGSEDCRPLAIKEVKSDETLPQAWEEIAFNPDVDVWEPAHITYTESMQRNVQSQLTDAEMTVLWKCYMSSLRSPMTPIEPGIVSLALRNNVLSLLHGKVPSLTDPFIYHCHIGDPQGGHWVAFVSGGKDGKLRFYDGYSSDDNFRQGLSILRRLHPDIQEEDIIRPLIEKQIGETCGHYSTCLAYHFIMGKEPPADIHLKSREWVDLCLRAGQLVFFS